MRALALGLFLVAGCSAQDQQQANMASDTVTAQIDTTSNQAVSSVDDSSVLLPADETLAGRWTGPEGLFADITPQGDGRYSVAMQYSLDKTGTFEATREGETLVLNRPGGRVTLSYGAGAQTGMKWVAPGAHCLIAVVGSEAYCRDAP